MIPTRRVYGASDCLKVAVLALVMLWAAAGAAQAEENIILGGSIPFSGPYGFAGKEIYGGITDYLKILNDAGGIHGRKVEIVAEDTGYKVDDSLAAFNKIVSSKNPHIYFADSTGFQKAINSELNRRGTILMVGTSYSSFVNNAQEYPCQFLAGPDYGQMVKMLLAHVAKEMPKSRVALVYADNENGRDPIALAKQRSAELGLEVVTEVTTAVNAVDVTAEASRLRRANPNVVIFQGFTIGPIPEFIKQVRDAGMNTQFMSNFWMAERDYFRKYEPYSDGYIAVVPYNYFDDPSARGPMIDKMRELNPDKYRTFLYFNGFLGTMLLTESVKRTLDANKPLNCKNLKDGLHTIRNFDTGGIMGRPITITGNSIPIGRMVRYDAKQHRVVPMSDWMTPE